MKALFDQKAPGLFLTRHRLLLHVLFWVGLVLYDGFVWGLVDGIYVAKFISSLAELPVKIVATYFTLYVLIDKFLVQKRYTTFVVLLALSMFVFGALVRVISYYTIYPLYYPEGLSIPVFFLPKILIAIAYTYSPVAIVATVHLMKTYYTYQQETQRLQQAAQQLEKEKLAAELKLLKSQINPHFLFNTLNNLYALTLHHAHQAPDMVHKLSELMSYMLYDSNQNEVPLEKEIRYIRNYIDLEKMRYSERLEVVFRIYENVDGITVAPLLILPFVENSFKHGASNQLNHGWIHIDVSIQQDVLVLRVENSKPDYQDARPRTSGIGLENVRKRLNHLYPNRHSLKLFDEPDTYLAVLKISLTGQAIEEVEAERELIQ